MSLRGIAAVVGLAERAPQRYTEGETNLDLLSGVAVDSLADAGIARADVDGLLVHPIGGLPGFVPATVAEFVGLRPRFAELVDLGGQGILIPDFVFTHAKTGKKVHLEILGFWRRGAVASRVALLKERGPENLIVAVSKELHVGEEKLAGLPGQVYGFRTSPVAREVRKLLGEFG